MAHPDWNASYAAGELPWDTGEPDPLLVEVIGSGAIPPGTALEVGCGTGTNAVWLSKQGFNVLGVDLSPLAIEKAKAKASGSASCRFEVLDFLARPPTGGPFSVVFDRGCFHVFDEAEERTRFAARVAEVLAPGGRWLSLIGSTEGPARDMGPPRRSVRDIASAVEPALEILSLRSVEFGIREAASFKAWLCLSRRRDAPAQPTSRR